MPPLKKADLRHEIDKGIIDARARIKRSRSLRTRSTQEGRLAALQDIRAQFLGGRLPQDAK